MAEKKIRVLVVDDSAVSRQLIVNGISADPMIEVAAVAADPLEAQEKTLSLRPDVITCDVFMPKMSGIEFARWLKPRYSVPLIMVSAFGNTAPEALEAGAVDYVAKPSGLSPKGTEHFISHLIASIKTATGKNHPLAEHAAPAEGEAEQIIAIGASTGGTDAIYNVLRLLPPTVPGIVIVQHIPPMFSRMFAERLDQQTSLRVKEAASGDYVERGKVLIAPGDRHMRVKRVGGRYKVECYQGDKVSGHCPSVDVLFDSVAKEAGKNAIGVILTGMGRDGAKGLLSLRKAGGRTIGQDAASSVVYGMPKAAFDIGAVEMQASLENIPQALLKLI